MDDDLSEAGLDLERREFGKRLDALLIARGWNPKARRNRRPFTFSTRRHAPDSFHVVLDAIMPEAAAKDIAALVARHGFTETPQPQHPTKRP